jgi:starch-binding outer membrane protein SusE/F
MKIVVNKWLLLGVVAILFAACKKDEQKAILNSSATAPVLTASSTTLVLDSTNAAQTKALTFSWPAVNYGAKVAPTYTLQIDSANGTFQKPVNVILGNGTSQSYTVADFNTLATSLGLTPGTAGQLQVRVKADVNQSTGTPTAIPTLYSNVVKLTVTPYSTKPQPKYPVPADLYLVGDATPSGWNNPVDTPSQKFTRVDDNTFALILPLTGGKSYLLLPKNGDWSHKYAVNGSPDPSSGEFVPDAPNNIPGPATSGLYKIVVDFVKGTYTVTPVAANPVPSNLYIVGDATAGGWNNPVPVPSQQFTQVSNGEYKITIPLTGGKSYLFLPLNGDWGHKYGGTSKTGGTLLADSSVPGSNTPAPDASGTYTIDVNFFAQTYSVTQ